MTAFTDYFIDSWFKGKYPLAIWNHCDNNGPRTNNHVEGYNANLAEEIKQIVKKISCMDNL